MREDVLEVTGSTRESLSPPFLPLSPAPFLAIRIPECSGGTVAAVTVEVKEHFQLIERPRSPGIQNGGRLLRVITYFYYFQPLCPNPPPETPPPSRSRDVTYRWPTTSPDHLSPAPPPSGPRVGAYFVTAVFDTYQVVPATFKNADLNVATTNYRAR